MSQPLHLVSEPSGDDNKTDLDLLGNSNEHEFCSEKFLEAIKSSKNELPVKVKSRENSPEQEKPGKWTPKYSYPNYNVGNEELGSSGNPNALSWPFGQK